MSVDIRTVAYYSLIFALVITIPQILSLSKDDGYKFISTSALSLNIFLFGVFTLYAMSFDDYLIAFLYGATCLANIYILYLKQKNETYS
jgi:hypothetical protein